MGDIEASLITGEQVVRKTRKHWFAPLSDSKWAILSIIGALVAAWLQTEATGGVMGFVNRVLGLIQLGLFLGGLGWIVYNIVAWRTAEYYVTNRRVLGHDGLVRRRETDTLLTSISDVRSVAPALGRVLGYGHLRILTGSGEAGAETLSSIRDAEGFKKEILEQKTGTASLAEARAMTPPPAATAPASPAAPSQAQLTATLAELGKLRDAGTITPAEFEAKKTDLLARI